MRHRKKKGRFSRRTSYRKATLKSLTNDLFTYQRIETTMAKAKALRSYAEPLITLAKKNPDSVSARRQAFRKLCDKDVIKNLFDEIAPLYRDIPGGYTRIMALGSRKGDGAQVAIMELTKRTISDEDLLGVKKVREKAKEKAKKKKAAGEVARKEEGPKAETHVAPEVDIEAKEERSVEDIKKEKAKTEQKKITKKGFFRRFRRKSMG
ncbi:MAG: 50S ribosomal protein L17 [Candidatus Omnitrophota bacterium]|nr:50S ribosomal protein L17 [Candidatus Omnitrophota bacterium]